MTPAGEITVAGILLFGKDPQAFLPQSGITYVRFHGKEPQSAHSSARTSPDRSRA